MDYMLKEQGNTYIQAITSHTSYWSNPDLAYFMLTKVHPELDKLIPEAQKQQRAQKQQQQQQQQQPVNPNPNSVYR